MWPEQSQVPLTPTKSISLHWIHVLLPCSVAVCWRVWFCCVFKMPYLFTFSFFQPDCGYLAGTAYLLYVACWCLNPGLTLYLFQVSQGCDSRDFKEARGGGGLYKHRYLAAIGELKHWAYSLWLCYSLVHGTWIRQQSPCTWEALKAAGLWVTGDRVAEDTLGGGSTLWNVMRTLFCYFWVGNEVCILKSLLFQACMTNGGHPYLFKYQLKE